MDINDYLKELEKIATREFPDVWEKYSSSFSDWWNNPKNPKEDLAIERLNKQRNATDALLDAFSKSKAATELRETYERSKEK